MGALALELCESPCRVEDVVVVVVVVFAVAAIFAVAATC